MGVLRTTFVIDREGIIVKLFKRPKVSEHSEQIVKALENVGKL